MEKTSLKNILKHYIYQRGRITLDELEALIKRNGYKISNGERRMREIVNEGKIAPIRNKNGAIVGYDLISKKTANRGQNKPNFKRWQDRLRYERELYKINQLPRDKNGRIIACG